MPWPLTTTQPTEYQKMAATDLLQAWRQFLDPCTLTQSPSYATMYQTVVIHRILSEGLLPVSYEGALTFIVGNGGVRPPEVQQVWTEAFTTEAAQAEQRLTNGGPLSDPNATTWLFSYYGWLWAADLVKQGKKTCWLSQQGFSVEQGVAYAMERVKIAAARLPASLFQSPEFQRGDAPILYVPGVMDAVEIPDDPAQGGPGTTPIGGSSISRPDDKYYYPDGTIRTVQGVVIGTFDLGNGALKPSDIVTIQGAGGSSVTTDGTGRVLASSPPGGTNVQTLYSPAAPVAEGWAGTESAAGSPAPIVYADPNTPSPVSGVVSATGRPATDSSPASGGGTATAPISAVVVDGAPAATNASADFQLPTWALVLGGVALVVLLMPGRGR